MFSFFQSLRRSLEGRQTVKAHLWQTAASYLQYGSALVLGVVLARLMNPEVFGQYAFIAATVLLCLLPTNWNLTQAIVSDGGKDKTLFGQVMAFTWCMMPLRLLIVTGLTVYFLQRGDHTGFVLCLMVGISVVLREVSNVHRAVLEASGHFRTNFHASVITLFCGLVAIPAALAGWGPYALALGPMLAAIAILPLYRNRTRKPYYATPSLAAVRRHLHTGFALWIGGASDLAMIRLDKWFLGHFGSDVELGNYNRAYNYTTMSHLMLNSFVTSATVSALARSESEAHRRRLFFKSCLIVFGGGFLNFLLFHFFSEPLVPFIFGEQWRMAVPTFEASAGLSLALAVLYMPLVMLQAKKRFRTIASVRVLGVGAMVAAFWFWRGSLGGVEAAYILQGACMLQGVVLGIAVWKIGRKG